MRWIIAALVMGPVTLSGCGLVAALAWPLAASRSPNRSRLAKHGLLAVVDCAGPDQAP